MLKGTLASPVLDIYFTPALVQSIDWKDLFQRGIISGDQMAIIEKSDLSLNYDVTLKVRALLDTLNSEVQECVIMACLSELFSTLSKDSNFVPTEPIVCGPKTYDLLNSCNELISCQCARCLCLLLK